MRYIISTCIMHTIGIFVPQFDAHVTNKWRGKNDQLIEVYLYTSLYTPNFAAISQTNHFETLSSLVQHSIELWVQITTWNTPPRFTYITTKACFQIKQVPPSNIQKNQSHKVTIKRSHDNSIRGMKVVQLHINMYKSCKITNVV